MTMNIDWVELSRAVPNAAIAVVFGVFMLLFLKILGEQRAAEQARQFERDADNAARYLEREHARDIQWLSAIERRDADWRGFMAEQQTARGEQWRAVVVELKSLATATLAMASLLQAHDSWERGLLSTLQRRRAGETPIAEESNDA